jgi:hypothetical protein
MGIARVVIFQPEMLARFDYVGLDELVDSAGFGFCHVCSRKNAGVSRRTRSGRVQRGEGRNFVGIMTLSQGQLQVDVRE